MKKVIFTADDYGALTCIDDGIIEAIQSSRVINSVAAFANGSRAGNRLKRLNRECPTIEIGCHFTLTSGKPVCNPEEVPSLVDSHGLFHDFKEFQYLMKPEEVEKELKAQLDVFRNAGIAVSHLSSHHGSLDFFEKFHQILIRVANTYSNVPIPVRSPVNEPDWKRVAYQLLLRWHLEDDLTDKQMRFFIDFQKEIKTKGSVRKLLKKYGYPSTPMPHHLDNSHISRPKNKILPEKKVNALAKNKKKSLINAIRLIPEQSETVEFVFHLISDDYDRIPEFQKESKNYGGVNPAYFDGRLAEIRSAKKLSSHTLKKAGAEMVSWSSV